MFLQISHMSNLICHLGYCKYPDIVILTIYKLCGSDYGISWSPVVILKCDLNKCIHFHLHTILGWVADKQHINIFVSVIVTIVVLCLDNVTGNYTRVYFVLKFNVSFHCLPLLL